LINFNLFKSLLFQTSTASNFRASINATTDCESSRYRVLFISNAFYIGCFLYKVFDIESLTIRERYQDHNREYFDAAIDIAQSIAEKYYVPFRLKGDCNQPTFDSKKVHIVHEIKEGLDAVIEVGLTAPITDYAMVACSYLKLQPVALLLTLQQLQKLRVLLTFHNTC
jgi:hypothetical protein